MFNFLNFFFGSKNERLLKEYSIYLKKINNLEQEISLLTDDELKNKYNNLKLSANSDISFLLPPVYAIVREVSKRLLNMRHFDVQILAGIALFNNKIVEVSTGEGKTLIATLPVCLNFILQRNVHIITVNEYLAYRDANWMKPIYEFLGLKVSVIRSCDNVSVKKEAYKSDVLYGTCNEFGFDYLRDNIALSISDKVQSNLLFAIIDEVDSILIDEARTPLIISLPDNLTSNYYFLIYKLVNEFTFLGEDDLNNDIILDFKSKNVYFTDLGFQKAEYILKKSKIMSDDKNLYDFDNIELLHIIYASLKAKFFFKRDIDYILDNDEVLIIDENTGRIMDGRRWGDGLHQAIEAKEGLKVKSENQTLASITFQNFFKLYTFLSGMTGTAITESAEFYSIYNLEVIVIPTNKTNIRIDNTDLIFLTKKGKYKAIINDISSCYSIGRPVLVGTVSIDVSETLSNYLKKLNIKHNVLNAKYHDKESIIIAEAGSFKNVTIATNMAGRGTDIILGGSLKLDKDNLRDKILSLGGLKVIGTERHESRRIDNQLRGRCARQGDPGSTQFYISLEDDLIKIFIADEVLTFLNKLNISDNDVISHNFISKAIENAQHKVESYNFDLRKQLLEYDDIINEQRKVFYQFRDTILIKDDLFDLIKDLISDLIEAYFSDFLLDVDKFKFDDLISKINLDFSVSLEFNSSIVHKDDFVITFSNILSSFYEAKRSNFLNLFNVNLFEKSLFLQILDFKWRDHLADLDYLKKGIHLRGYAQKDPKEEYKKESFFLFKSMLYNCKYEFLTTLFRIPFKNFLSDNFIKHTDSNSLNLSKKNEFFIEKNKKNKIGRNDLCFCNSNKKYKFCHGKYV